MNFKLKPKLNILPYILGGIDQLDINWYMNKVVDSKNGISGTSNLLICFNPTLIESLYKYDQQNASYISDWTEAGENICKDISMELVSDNILKIEANYDLVRTFSFKKSSYDSVNSTGFISIDPVMLLDYENLQLKQIFSENELISIFNSKLLGVTINNNYQKAIDNKNATRSTKIPSYIKHFSILNNKINYIETTEAVIDSFGNSINIKTYTDSDLSEDIYQKNNKSFSVINDSTIGLRFLIYIDISLTNYLVDSNDININYHVNVNTINNVLHSSGVFNITLYEKIDDTMFPVDKNVYIKNIYTDEIVAVAKVNNVTNNTISLTGAYCKSNDMTISNMDEFVLTKIYDMENFNTIFTNNIFYKMIKSNNLILDDIKFGDADYKLKSELY